MASAEIPVDIRNPGQVFACLGLMEATEILSGPCEGAFGYLPGSTAATFRLDADGPDNPIRAALAFLVKAEAKALAPEGSDLSTAKWDVETIAPETRLSHLGREFPAKEPGTPAALPIILTDGDRTVPISHWADDFGSVGRDNVKFWAGAGGYPGAALARDALELLRDIGGEALDGAAADPFSVTRPQSSSFRFDWRRDYIPLGAGFSPNMGSANMVGYPLVELLAAIGLEHARPERPDRRNKLLYRYAVSSIPLPTVLARAVLGCSTEARIIPRRIFRAVLDWPGQENQARSIINAEEEPAS